MLLRLFLAVIVAAPIAWAGTEASAHRGDVRSFPENTIPAIHSAVLKGAAQIEFDCQLTRDGEVVLMHDATIDRTTDGSGKVGDYTLAELKEMDAGSWFDPRFAGTRIPTLRETLSAIPRHVQCNVHLKETPGLAAAVAKIIAEMNRLDQCFLASSKGAAAEAREVAPGIRHCNMDRQGGDRDAYVQDTVQAGAQFIQLLGDRTNLKPTVEQLHANGITVNFFYGNTPDQIRALRDAGVDFILTDDLDVCLAILRE